MLSFLGAHYVESYADEMRRLEEESAAKLIQEQEAAMRQQARLDDRRQEILNMAGGARGGSGGQGGVLDRVTQDELEILKMEQKKMQKMEDLKARQMAQAALERQAKDQLAADDEGDEGSFKFFKRLVKTVGKTSGKIKNISPFEVPQMLRYALLAENVYEKPENRVSAGDSRIVQAGWTYVSDAPGVDAETAVYIDQRQREVAVSFRGTVNMKDVVSDAQILFSRESSNRRFKNSESILRQVKSKYPGYKIVTTGHSLGGRLALYAGMRQGADFMYLFNPGLSPQSLGQDCKMKQNQCKNNLIIYTTGSDFISISAIFSKGVKIIRVPETKKSFLQSMKDKIPGMGMLNAHTMSNFTKYSV